MFFPFLDSLNFLCISNYSTKSLVLPADRKRRGELLEALQSGFDQLVALQPQDPAGNLMADDALRLGPIVGPHGLLAGLFVEADAVDGSERPPGRSRR